MPREVRVSSFATPLSSREVVVAISKFSFLSNEPDKTNLVSHYLTSLVYRLLCYTVKSNIPLFQIITHRKRSPNEDTPPSNQP